MDIKKTFSPSTWGLRLSSVEALRAGELSILFPLTTAYTIVYLGMMIAWGRIMILQPSLGFLRAPSDGC